MNKYFEVKPDCELYRDYFAYKEDEPKIVAAFKSVCEKFGIEAEGFYMKKDRLWIKPTLKDNENFSGMMKKTNYREFKRNSAPSKMWVELVKNIEHFEKPRVMFYLHMMCYRWKERLFHVGEKLYCSIESDSGEISTPDFAVEMKASEFYKIIEDVESEGKEDE